MTQWKDNIKPKVITKIGQVIEPIKAPKNIKNGWKINVKNKVS